jgi:hypothetical protein
VVLAETGKQRGEGESDLCSVTGACKRMKDIYRWEPQCERCNDCCTAAAVLLLQFYQRTQSARLLLAVGC